MKEQTTPRIYVACLAAYNNSTLHGEWIDADEVTTLDELQDAIASMLADSPLPNAEEWAIHDYEGFPFKLSEHEALQNIADAFEFWNEDEEKFAICAEWHGWNSNNTFRESWEAYDDAYMGTFESVADYVEEYWRDCGGYQENREGAGWWHPNNYVDWDRMVRDLELSGDITSVDLLDGDVAIFSAH